MTPKNIAPNCKRDAEKHGIEGLSKPYSGLTVLSSFGSAAESLIVVRLTVRTRKSPVT